MKNTSTVMTGLFIFSLVSFVFVHAALPQSPGAPNFNFEGVNNGNNGNGNGNAAAPGLNRVRGNFAVESMQAKGLRRANEVEPIDITAVRFDSHAAQIDAELYRINDTGDLEPVVDVWVNQTTGKFGAFDEENQGSHRYTYVFTSEFPSVLHQKSDGSWWFGRYKVETQDICAENKTPQPSCEFSSDSYIENESNTLYYELRVNFTSGPDIDPTYTELDDGDIVVVYDADGTFNLSSETTVEYLVVAGGGGGGGEDVQGANGQNSVFHNITATGGGGGGGSRFSNINGRSGGSGGGGGAHANGDPSSGGTGISGQGNNGGGSGEFSDGGAGGGGAGQGGSGAPTNDVGGSGGTGIQSNITGTLTYYAGGGGGGANTGEIGGCGGLGGGGAGGDNIAGSSCAGGGKEGGAVDGTGGGGGGGFDGNRGGGGGGAGGMLTGTMTLAAGSYTVDVGTAGGNGGDGIVILRYPDVCSPPAGENWVFDVSNECPLNETIDLGNNSLVLTGASGIFNPSGRISAKGLEIRPDDFNGDFTVNMKNIEIRK